MEMGPDAVTQEYSVDLGHKASCKRHMIEVS